MNTVYNFFKKMQPNIGENYLSSFDSLNLEQKENCRLAVYALVDFYGSVMAIVGKENLHLAESIKRDSLSPQWNRITRELEQKEDYSTPDRYRGLAPQLQSIRNDTAHNYQYHPPKGQIERLREIAPDWRDWLLRKTTDSVHKEWRELNSQQQNILETITTHLGNEKFSTHDLNTHLENSTTTGTLNRLAKTDHLDRVQTGGTPILVANYPSGVDKIAIKPGEQERIAKEAVSFEGLSLKPESLNWVNHQERIKFTNKFNEESDSVTLTPTWTSNTYRISDENE